MENCLKVEQESAGYNLIENFKANLEFNNDEAAILTKFDVLIDQPGADTSLSLYGNLKADHMLKNLFG